MKKIIIHVGSGKAGSTSIQQALFHGLSINNASYTYPVMPYSPGNQVIRYAFCRENSVPQNIRDKYSNDERTGLHLCQEIIKSFFRDQCQYASTVIVSSERLFHACEDEVLDLGIFLRQLDFSEIHVLMYLRDPAKYYISSAQQALKRRHKIPLPSTFRYDMLGAIDRWSKIMPTSITIREFDTLSLCDGDVIKDFVQYLKSLGVEARLHIDHPLNESMSSEVTQAIQDSHHYLANNMVDDQFRSKMIRKIKRLIRFGVEGGSKPKLKRRIERCIDKRFGEDLRALYSRYGIFERILSRISLRDVNGLPNYDFSDFLLFRELVETFDEKLYERIKYEMLDF